MFGSRENDSSSVFAEYWVPPLLGLLVLGTAFYFINDYRQTKKLSSPMSSRSAWTTSRSRKIPTRRESRTKLVDRDSPNLASSSSPSPRLVSSRSKRGQKSMYQYNQLDDNSLSFPIKNVNVDDDNDGGYDIHDHFNNKSLLMPRSSRSSSSSDDDNNDGEEVRKWRNVSLLQSKKRNFNDAEANHNHTLSHEWDLAFNGDRKLFDDTLDL